MLIIPYIYFSLIPLYILYVLYTSDVLMFMSYYLGIVCVPILFDGRLNERDNYVDYKLAEISMNDGMSLIELEQSIIGRVGNLCNSAPLQLFVSV